MERKLHLGTAYHCNRILRHVEEDMIDIVNHHMNTVVHMFTHNDMERHRSVLKDIISMSESLGLDVWLDNWGIDGGPGDKCHFTAYHPEAKMVFKDGTSVPLKPCYRHPAFREFTREWVDAVQDAGGKTLFWDEPHLTASPEHGPACFCPICRQAFEERFGHNMSEGSEDEYKQFGNETIADYFRFATDYAHSKGLKNTGCIMFSPKVGSDESLTDTLMALPNFDSVGCDPYWVSSKNPSITAEEVYDYVYKKTSGNLSMCNKYGKEHNVWLQGYHFTKGREEEMVIAANAIFDAGARTILSWSFRGGESNDYRAENCDMIWELQGDIMSELRRRYFCETLDSIRKSGNYHDYS